MNTTRSFVILVWLVTAVLCSTSTSSPKEASKRVRVQKGAKATNVKDAAQIGDRLKGFIKQASDARVALPLVPIIPITGGGVVGTIQLKNGVVYSFTFDDSTQASQDLLGLHIPFIFINLTLNYDYVLRYSGLEIKGKLEVKSLKCSGIVTFTTLLNRVILTLASTSDIGTVVYSSTTTTATNVSRNLDQYLKNDAHLFFRPAAQKIMEYAAEQYNKSL